MQVNGSLTEPGKSVARPGPRAGPASRRVLVASWRRWPILGRGARPAGEKVHVNPGGGPDRDDTGLPPVDVEIPDDARELDRDVQAYRREQRAQRRRRRSGRLQTVVSRDGMVMPLLICCLIFALITGTLLTFFTSTSLDQAGLQGSGTKPGGKPASPGASAPSLGPPVATPAPVVGTYPVRVAGRTRAVRTLGPAVLLVASKDCRCSGAISAVAGQAAQAREAVYLVSGSGPSTGLGHGIKAATDVSGALASYQHAGLTAILVTKSGVVSYAQRLLAGSSLQDLSQAG